MMESAALSELRKEESAALRVKDPRSLSKREMEILQLVAEGYKNREVAEKLGISVKTVETHRSNLMNKLALRNLAHLINYAIRKGLTAI